MMLLTAKTIEPVEEGVSCVTYLKQTVEWPQPVRTPHFAGYAIWVSVLHSSVPSANRNSFEAVAQLQCIASGSPHYAAGIHSHETSQTTRVIPTLGIVEQSHFVALTSTMLAKKSRLIEVTTHDQ